MSFSDTPVLRPISNKRKPAAEVAKNQAEAQQPYASEVFNYSGSFQSNREFQQPHGSNNSNNDFYNTNSFKYMNSLSNNDERRNYSKNFFYDYLQKQKYPQNDNKHYNFTNNRERFQFYHYQRPNNLNQYNKNHQIFYTEPDTVRPAAPVGSNNFSPSNRPQLGKPQNSSIKPQNRLQGGQPLRKPLPNSVQRAQERNINEQLKRSNENRNNKSSSPKSSPKDATTKSNERKKLKILRHKPLSVSAKISPKKIIEKITKFDKESLKNIINNPSKYDGLLHNFQREQELEEERKRPKPAPKAKQLAEDNDDGDRGSFEIVPDDVVELPGRILDLLQRTSESSMLSISDDCADNNGSNETEKIVEVTAPAEPDLTTTSTMRASIVNKKHTPKTDLMSRIKAAESFKSSQAKQLVTKSRQYVQNLLRPRATSESQHQEYNAPFKETSIETKVTNAVNERLMSCSPSIKIETDEEFIDEPYSPSAVYSTATKPVNQEVSNKIHEGKDDHLSNTVLTPLEEAIVRSPSSFIGRKSRSNSRPNSPKECNNTTNVSIKTAVDSTESNSLKVNCPRIRPRKLSELLSAEHSSSTSSTSTSSSSSTSGDTSTSTSTASSRSNSSCSNDLKRNSVIRRRELLSQKLNIQHLIDIFTNVVLPKLTPALRRRFIDKYSTCLDAKLLFICRICTSHKYNTEKFTRDQIRKIEHDLKSTDKRAAIVILMREIVNVMNKPSKAPVSNATKRKMAQKRKAKRAQIAATKSMAKEVVEASTQLDISKEAASNQKEEQKRQQLEEDTSNPLNSSSVEKPIHHTAELPSSSSFPQYATLNAPLDITMPEPWASSVHEIDIRINDLVKRKQFVSEMIAKLQIDSLELDMHMLNLQKEKFMLLNAALTAKAPSTNHTNTTIGSTTPASSLTNKHTKKNQQNSKPISNTKKTFKRHLNINALKNTELLSTESKSSKLSNLSSTKSTISTKPNLINGILPVEEPRNPSDKENEAASSMREVVVCENLNSNSFDYTNIPTGHLHDIHSPVNQVCVFEEFVVCATEDGHLYRYNMSTQKMVDKCKKHDSTITQMIFDEKRNLLFTTSLDNNFKQTAWHNLQADEQSIDLEEQLQSLDVQWDIAFIGTRLGNIFSCSTVQDQLLPEIICIGDSSIMAIKATKEGARKVLIISSKGNVILFRDAMTGLLLRTMNVTDNLCIYTFLFDESHLYCGTQRQQILKFDFNNGSHTSTFYCGNGVAAMRFYKNKYLIVVCYDGNIYFLDKLSGEKIDMLPAAGKLPLTLEIFGNKLLTSSKDKAIKIIDIPSSIVDG